MKLSRFTESQIINLLKQAEAGAPVPDLCREHGMSSATFYKWRAKYGGMDASMVSRMKELEDENRRLKKNGRRSTATSGRAQRGDAKKVVKPSQRREMARCLTEFAFTL